MDSTPCALKILVADDSPVYRKLVEESLSQERYTLRRTDAKLWIFLPNTNLDW